jgi:hypothetical protein
LICANADTNQGCRDKGARQVIKMIFDAAPVGPDCSNVNVQLTNPQQNPPQVITTDLNGAQSISPAPFTEQPSPCDTKTMFYIVNDPTQNPLDDSNRFKYGDASSAFAFFFVEGATGIDGA